MLIHLVIILSITGVNYYYLIVKDLKLFNLVTEENISPTIFECPQTLVSSLPKNLWFFFICVLLKDVLNYLLTHGRKRIFHAIETHH